MSSNLHIFWLKRLGGNKGKGEKQTDEIASKVDFSRFLRIACN